MITVKKTGNWKIYWGTMPLPEGAEALGIVSRDTGTGALIRLANGNYVQGNAGGIRTLPQSEVAATLDSASITPHKGGRTARFPDTRLTPEVREQLDEILTRRGISAADWVTEKIKEDANVYKKTQ